MKPQVPPVRVVTMDHPSSHVWSRLHRWFGTSTAALRGGVALAVGLWPLVAAMLLVGGLVASATLGADTSRLLP